MSDTTNPEAAGQAPAGAPAAKGPNKLVLPLVVAVMTVAGAAVGMVVIAPMLAADRAPIQAGLESPEPTEGEGGEHGGAEKGPTFKIDNLIVNPAGSQGSRFLMVSVAVETPDAKMEETLRHQESQIRDVVIALLEKQTMETLSSEGIRESLKSQLSDTITAIVAAKAKLRVFLPQFVIQ